jgi:hypothetical protein
VDGKSISLPFPFEGALGVAPLATGFGVDVSIEILESESDSTLVKSIVGVVPVRRKEPIVVRCPTVRRP